LMVHKMRSISLLTIALFAVVIICLTTNVSASTEEIELPKLIAKTVYDIKFIKNAETGELEEKKIPRKELYKVIQKLTSMQDPLDPTKTIQVRVPTEIKYDPNAKSNGKLGKLKKRLDKLQKRERALKKKYVKATSSLVDIPVLEDGAPAPPDRQQIKMAEDLYGELQATQLPKAKNIKQHILDGARTFVKDIGAQREVHWDQFNDMKQKMLVPSHGWGMSM